MHVWCRVLFGCQDRRDKYLLHLNSTAFFSHLHVSIISNSISVIFNSYTIVIMALQAGEHDDNSLQNIANDLHHIADDSKTFYTDVSNLLHSAGIIEPDLHLLKKAFFKGVQRFVTQWELLRQTKEKLDRKEAALAVAVLETDEKGQELDSIAIDNEALATRVCDCLGRKTGSL